MAEDEDKDMDEEIVVFAEPPTQDLKCSICLEVFRDPLITKCGHTFCSRCAFQVCLAATAAAAAAAAAAQTPPLPVGAWQRAH